MPNKPGNSIWSAVCRMISSRLPKNDRAKDVKKRLARSRRAALRKKIKIISRSHQDLAVQNAILRSYNQCLLWIWISINSRNRRTKKKELIRSMNLKYLPFLRFSHIFFQTQPRIIRCESLSGPAIPQTPLLIIHQLLVLILTPLG